MGSEAAALTVDAAITSGTAYRHFGTNWRSLRSEIARPGGIVIALENPMTRNDPKTKLATGVHKDELPDASLDKVAGGGAPPVQGGVAMNPEETNRNGGSGPVKSP